MAPDRWRKIEALYEAALEVEPAQRPGFLEESCSGDESLRHEVESLLFHHENAGCFLQVPAPAKELEAGQCVSHYEIQEKLGEGAMGVVYGAHDSQLRRRVALKVLPPDYALDSHQRQRLLREARVAAGLNHTNIVGIHEVGSDNGVDFIAMEFIEGDTLKRIIPAKRLPVREALDYAVQIARGLARAHASGVIHRDLKPGNIMVTPDGTVKLLDFGLARRLQSGEEHETTLTVEGDIVGTPAYMSPEQAEGKQLDARSDIFSFGSVLYEMLTGRQAFRGASKLSMLSSILRDTPAPLNSIRADVPAELDRILGRCLEKDRDARYPSATELLQDLVACQSRVAASAAGLRSTLRRPRIAIAALGLLALSLAAAAIGVWLVRSKRGAPEADLVPVPLTTYPGTEDYPSFSPDGTQVAFQWCPKDPGKSCQIYIKQIGVEPPVRLTDNAAMSISPAWSPDGRTIAFLRRLSQDTRSFSLVLIPQRGGRERVLAQVDINDAGDDGPYLAWTPDAKWLVCPMPDARNRPWSLYLFSVETGEKRKLTDTPPGPRRGLFGDTAPAFSPDGRLLAFTRVSDTGPGADLYLLHLGEGYRPLGEPERVRKDSGLLSLGAAWMPDGGEIVFASHAGLWRMALSKPATPRRLPFGPDNASAPAISRQGNRLAYSVGRFNANLWRIDLREPGHKPGAPVPFMSSSRTENIPAYSPDGKRIAFGSDRSGSWEIWVCEADGSNAVQLTSFGGPLVVGARWSPDSQTIAFWAEPGRASNLYIISAAGGAPRRLTTGPSFEQWPYWSHDGRWIYFTSNRSGSKQIWKMPVGGGEAIQITRDGADVAQESSDGKFVYYCRGYPFTGSLGRVSAEGGEGTRILGGMHPTAGWTLRTEGIYFCTAPDKQGRSDLSIYEFATGKTRKILTIEREVGWGLDVSPDGRTVLYSQVYDAGSDLMLVENFR